MNILIFCNILSIGGAERVAVSWANGLSRLGHNVYIMADTTVPQTYATDPDITIIRRPTPKKGSVNIVSKLLYRVRLINFIRETINKYKIDAVIKVLHVNGLELLVASRLCKKRPVVIMTDHNSYERPASAPLSHTAKWQKFRLNKWFDHVTVLTKRDKEITDAKGLKNVSVLYNPLFLPVREQIDRNKEKTILAVGRLDVWQIKGFDVLVKAWDRICDKYPDWRLKIVGGGSDKIREMLYALMTHPDRMEIKQFTSDIVNEYRKAEVFVLSSRCEGWGLVLVEAMSQRCAVIACDYEGRQSEIISDGESGLLCPPDDVKSLSEKMEYLLSDPSAIKHLQENSTMNLERFSEENVAKNFEKIILNSMK